MIFWLAHCSPSFRITHWATGLVIHSSDFTLLAVEDHGNSDGALWALNSGGLNCDMIREDRLLIVDEREFASLSIAFEPDPAVRVARKHKRNGAPGRRSRSDARVIVQQGALTIHGHQIDLAKRPVDGYPWLVGLRVKRRGEG